MGFSRLLAAVCALAALAPLCAQPNTGTIRGKVTLAKTQDPVHNVLIRVLPGFRTTRTADDGTFTFSGVPAGTYTVLAHAEALSDETRSVRLTPGGALDLTFALGVRPLRQEVTVTAGTEDLSINTIPTITTVDGLEAQTKAQAPSLGEMLEDQPGVAKRAFGPGNSRPVIRGFDGDRVLVLQDGARTGTLSSQSADHGEPIDPSDVERVEIVKGPTTLLYGSNALGGVVNIIGRESDLERTATDGVQGHLTALAGTNNSQFGGSGGLEFGRRNWAIWGGGGGQRNSDFRTPLGLVPNSNNYLRQTRLGGGVFRERYAATANYQHGEGRYGVPFAGILEGEPDAQIDIGWRRHFLRSLINVKRPGAGFENLQLIVNYSDWQHRELETEDGDEETKTILGNKQFAYHTLLRQERRGPLSGSFGVSGFARSFNIRGEESLSPPTRQNMFSAFAVQELGWERLKVQFGGRVERNSYNPDGLRRRTFTGFSGSAGLLLPLWTGSSLVANYTHSYRAPALEELYFNGPHPGNAAFEVGNANLRRERGDGYELSFRQQTGRVRAEINAYTYRFSDFVFGARGAEFADGLPVVRYLQAPTRYLGADARLTVPLRDWLLLHTGFDVVDAQIRNTRQPLPRIPPVRGRISLDGRWKGLSIRPELFLSNAQNQLYAGETRTAGFAVANLQALYTLAGTHASHTFSFLLFNAADRLYRNHLNLIKEFVPEIGRGARFGYTIHFF